MTRSRIEKDSLGRKNVPMDAYYGIFTQRAIENFPISGMHAPRRFRDAIVTIKIAAAYANRSLGMLDGQRAGAIVKAAKDIMKGKLDAHFPLDVYQAGAGTPYNMNVNEVIANRANVLLGTGKGRYQPVHPNDHVNLGQSTNDVIPTALRITLLQQIPDLQHSIHILEKTFRKKASQFHRIAKSGRTHLQDAVPVTLGQEFHAYASAMKKNRERIQDTVPYLREISIGGTAVGTGVNAHPRYRKAMLRELRKETKLKLSLNPDPLEGAQFTTDYLQLSETLSSLCVDLLKISNDLQLLSSGPRTGFNEIDLPDVEPGSSIMPGKVNPSMLEMLSMVCYQVIGNTHTIEQASEAGKLELNVMNPLIMHNLTLSLHILTNALREVEKHCIRGIKANKEVCQFYYLHSSGIATLVAPIIGYAAAAELAKEALRKKKNLPDLIREKDILNAAQLKQLLKIEHNTQPNLDFVKKFRK